MSKSEVRSRHHYRGSGGGYESGGRAPEFSQGSGSFEYRKGSRSPSPEYDRSPDRARGRERERSRYRSPSRSPGGPYSGSGYRGYRNSMSQRFMPEPSRVLGVFGLNMRTNERDLRKLFSAYGEVDKVVIIYHHATQQSRRFGFVSFKTLESASLARRKVNGMEFHGRKVRVDYSVTQRAHSPTPGRYMGREKSRRRSYRSGGYGDYPRDDFDERHGRYDRRDRERDHSFDSYHRPKYDDRPPVEEPPSEEKWAERKECYPSREPPRSPENNENNWQREENPESHE